MKRVKMPVVAFWGMDAREIGCAPFAERLQRGNGAVNLELKAGMGVRDE